MLLANVCILFFAVTQSAQAIAISPVMIDLEIERGQAQDGVITLQNTGPAAATYFISAQNFVSKGEEGQQEFVTDNQLTDLAAWIKPEVESITLKSNEVQAVHYSVRVPTDAAPGGHYAAVFFSTQPSAGEGATAVGVGTKTGALFLVRVPGKIVESAEIKDFSSPNRLYNSLPASFILRIQNLGNVHLRPQGQIVIKNIFGQVVENVPLNPTEATVLPNGLRRLETAWIKVAAPQGSGALAGLKNEWKNFALGRYTADLQANYGRSNLSLAAQLTFWVIPWRSGLLILVGLILIWLMIKGYNRMVVMRALGRHMKQAK
jgi:hypothetical protein